MKSFIVLTVAIGLISVQGTSINQQVLDNDHGLNNDRDYTIVDDRDAIITGQIRDELQNMETLEDGILEKKEFFSCQNHICKACALEFCLSAGYNQKTKKFTFGVKHGEEILYEYTIKKAIRWSDCEKIKMKFFTQTVCLKVDNMRLTQEGQACLDAKISASFLSKTFKDICM